jgi:hypothetical protein
MAAKRATKAAQDAQETRANEAIRRKAGQDAGRATEDLKIKQMAKEAEQKKRGVSFSFLVLFSVTRI